MLETFGYLCYNFVVTKTQNIIVYFRNILELSNSMVVTLKQTQNKIRQNFLHHLHILKMTIENSIKDTPKEKSALEENIESKGKNAYYFAHAHKANGPKWDGKAEPKLLSMETLSVNEKMLKQSHSSFNYHKSNITSYAFADGKKSVKLYIEMEGVGEKVRFCLRHLL